MIRKLATVAVCAMLAVAPLAVSAQIAAGTQLAGDRQVRAVVLSGEGPAFCAGHDMKELTAHRNDADRGQAAFVRIMTACSAMMPSVPTESRILRPKRSTSAAPSSSSSRPSSRLNRWG